MGIVNWITGIFSGPADDGVPNDCSSNTLSSMAGSFRQDDVSINPATGLPMVDGDGSVDVAGNPFGTDLSQDARFSAGIDDAFCGGMADSLSSGHGFDDG